MSENKKLILASGSAVRARLLSAAGVDFVVQVSGVDEAAIKADFEPKDDFAGLALALAEAKAKAVYDKAETSKKIILGADQLLVFEDKIFDKAENMEEARARLKILRGKTHALIGGAVLLAGENGAVVWQHNTQAEMVMRDFSDEFLDDYLRETGADILASVGAYQLEGLGSQLFEKIDGDYSGILGLSILPLLAALRANGVLEK